MRKLTSVALLTGLILTALPLATFALPTGSEAPDFVLKNLDGKTVRLSDYRDRFVILKLGSTQCPTCLEQIEEIREIDDYLEKKDVVFLDVFLRDSKEMIEKTVGDEKFPMTAEILVGDVDVYKDYRVFLIPRVLLIGPDGEIIRDGSMWTAYDIKRRIEKYLPSEEKAAQGGD